MLFSEKITGSNNFILFTSKEAYSIVSPLEKILVKKPQAKEKCVKNKYWDPPTLVI